MTRCMALCFGVMLAVTAGASSAQDVAPADAPRLDAIAATGAAMYRLDQATAMATDLAQAQRVFRRDKRVRGWITEDLGSAVAVYFLDEAGRAIYRVDVSDSDEVPGALQVMDTPLVLEGDLAASAQARASALAALEGADNFGGCSRQHNTVVLPVEGHPGRFHVYILPGTTRRHVVPIGGSYRVEVDNGRVIAQRPYTRSCIELQNPPGNVAMMITHLLDDAPTEVHVFWSLWAGTTMVVATDAGVWRVENGQVTLRSKRESAD